MATENREIDSTPRQGLPFTEFVAMMAAAIALVALAIDVMLPALPAIGDDLSAGQDNQLQWIVALFFLGNGIGQIVFGPLADRLGRRPVLLTGITLYCILALIAAFAPNLHVLLGVRLAHGLAAAAASVIPRSIIRDRYVGAQMAKVMSLTYIVFMTVPVLAPSIGQLLLLLMPWRGVFVLLALAAAGIGLWIARRLPETLHADHRRALSLENLLGALSAIVSEPTALYYMLAMTAIYGVMVSYLTALPQIFGEYFHRPALMPMVFAFCSITMALASFVNARVVERIGMRIVSHSALAGLISISLVHGAFAWTGSDSLIVFTICQALALGFFGISMANFSAITMQKMGAVAGSAASIQGVMTMIGGALVGSLIGHQWSGDVIVLPIGTALCGIVAGIMVAIGERGKLFRK